MKRSHGNVPWNTCPHCGKRSYASRGDAKLAARRGRDSAEQLRAYRCHADGTRWHLGHLSWAARTGIGARPRHNTSTIERAFNG